MSHQKKILVTGGAGYLGHNLIPKIKDEVIVYDNLTFQDDYFESFTFVKADVTDHDTLKKYLDQVDIVVWLAGIVGDAACSVNPTRAVSVNVEALEFLAENFDGRIIFTSSCSTYGWNEELVNEESHLAPLSLYAENKIQGEEILKSKDSIILRLGTLHGVSKRMRFDLVINILTLNAFMKGKIEIYGGKQYRPFLSVKDVASLISQIIEEEYEKGIYNVSSENFSIIEVGNMVKKHLPETEIEILSSEFEDKRNYKVDSEKALRKLAFCPEFGVADSIIEIFELLKSGRIKDPYDHRYINVKYLGKT